ncbi:hypothetical protein AXG93_4343s1490 [Marchantia polymorpha subsp. ruderalis]|uniref:Uncharacterized protein n=1 Tax=Marchantia polymorpha subsp. ruderalis TaxID=1480154 RepID=A0A176VU98_MARPO|nr:hypothetical protein AXG93_4343s1490 [Marchantia polymorpha subsp. ruderalis]
MAGLVRARDCANSEPLTDRTGRRMTGSQVWGREMTTRSFGAEKSGSLWRWWPMGFSHGGSMGLNARAPEQTQRRITEDQTSTPIRFVVLAYMQD